MADVWVNAITVVLRSKWTPELKQQTGESVLEALFQRIQENSKLPNELDGITEGDAFVKYMNKDNSPHNATITVNSN